MLENEKVNPDELKVPQLATIPAEEVNENEELNTETPDEEKELSEEELKEIYIEQLKASRIKFHPIKHPIKREVVGEKVILQIGSYKRKRKEISTTIQTNITTNQFGVAHKKERKRKNKLTKASRRANRKK